MEISVVLPAYNEEKRIGGTLHELGGFLSRHYANYEVIVVDDGSTDRTSQISLRSGVKVIRNKKNRGKGLAVRKGVCSASYPVVLMTDSDLATPIHEVIKLHEILDKGNDIVIGSRNMLGSDVQVYQPFYRRLAGQLFPFAVRLMLGLKYRDTQCGFKIFRTQIMKDIMKLQTLDGFAFDVELLYIAQKKGIDVKEVPVIWRSKGESKVGFFRDSGSMFLDLVRIRFNDLKGKYL